MVEENRVWRREVLAELRVESAEGFKQLAAKAIPEPRISGEIEYIDTVSLAETGEKRMQHLVNHPAVCKHCQSLLFPLQGRMAAPRPHYLLNQHTRI